MMRCAAALTALLAASAFAAAGAHAATLTNSATRHCLDANIHQGVFLNSCNGGSYQDWTPQRVSGTTVKLYSGSTKKCLDGNKHQGVFLNTCTSGDTYQEWTASTISGTTVSLKSVATKLCLNGTSAETTSLGTCNGSHNEDWLVTGTWAYCLVNCAPPPTPPKKTTPPKTTPPPKTTTSPPKTTTTPKTTPGSSQTPSSSSSPSSPLPAPSSPIPPASSPPPPVRHKNPLAHRRKAHVSLDGTPKSLRNGQTVHLKGRVTKARVATGVVIELEARGIHGGPWMLFKWTRTHAHGKFHVSYTFRRTTGRQFYMMRAVLPTQLGYRAHRSFSNVFRVEVTGPAT